MDGWNIDPNQYEIKGDKVYKAKSNTVIYDMNTGKYIYDFAFYIASKNCEETEFKYEEGTDKSLSESRLALYEYIKEFTPRKDGVIWYPIRPSTLTF